MTGPESLTTGVLSAMAMELATSRWSGPLHLTLAGFGEDLATLAPDRITAVPTLDQALPALEEHAAGMAGAMAASGVSSALEGRSLGASPDAWAPHYLISAVPPSPRERSRLLTMARVGRAAAAGYVIAGDVPGASWAWEVTPDGPARWPARSVSTCRPSSSRPGSRKRWWACSPRRPGGRVCRSPRRTPGPPPRSSWNPAAWKAGGDRHPGPGVGPGARDPRTGPGRPGH